MRDSQVNLFFVIWKLNFTLGSKIISIKIALSPSRQAFCLEITFINSNLLNSMSFPWWLCKYIKISFNCFSSSSCFEHQIWRLWKKLNKDEENWGKKSVMRGKIILKVDEESRKDFRHAAKQKFNFFKSYIKISWKFRNFFQEKYLKSSNHMM